MNPLIGDLTSLIYHSLVLDTLAAVTWSLGQILIHTDMPLIAISYRLMWPNNHCMYGKKVLQLSNVVFEITKYTHHHI